MSKVIIDQISFQNYRQYGTQTITFNHAKKHELFVIVARNGTGKTTFINAITWCLYGEEKLTFDKENTLPLVNTDVLSNSQEGDVVTVAVKLRIIDDTNSTQYLDFERRQDFKLVLKNDVLVPIGNTSVLKVHITQFNSPNNPEILEGNDAILCVKQYFDEPIHDFYFFDGENLKSYFEKDTTERIKNAVYNISQVTLLENTIKHIKALSQEITKKLGKDIPDINKLLEEQETIRTAIENANTFLRQSIEENDRKKEELDKIIQRQKQIQPIQDQIRRRDELANKVAGLEEDIKKNNEDISDFVRRYTILLNIYPRAKKVLSIIHEKQDAGDLPPVIDKHMIELLLQDPDAKCPICENNVNETAREHLQKLYERMSVSASTSAFLLEIKGTLERLIDEAEKYEDIKEELLDKKDDLNKQYEDADTQLKKYSKQISTFDQNLDDSDKNLEEKRLKCIEKIQNASQRIGIANKTIEDKTKEFDDLKKRIDEITAKKAQSQKLTKERDLLLLLEEQFETIKNNITSGMRREIEDRTLRVFLSMSPKRNTFGDIIIDDNYYIEVRDKDERTMRGSLSATETMALAYAFTMAIHTASGKNCPLVIDSPLGRVSDFNRENMARILFDTSTSKQIIMLFTPDEYSENVKKIYDGKVQQINLKLSADEKHVIGGEE